MTDDRPGYTDTPLLPDDKYRVHDPERPHPPAVHPGGVVTQDPPSDATILFDGDDPERWEHPDGRVPEWSVEDETLIVNPECGDLRTRESISDCQLHLEWAVPEQPRDGPYPGNSGVFLGDRYEIQILNDQDATIYADGYAGAVYGQHPPLVSAFTAPGEWQSFDIVWHPPHFDGDDLLTPATVTVLFNGILIQDASTVYGPTAHRDAPNYEPHPSESPVRLQDHGCRVGFRNIWYRSL